MRKVTIKLSAQELEAVSKFANDIGPSMTIERLTKLALFYAMNKAYVQVSTSVSETGVTDGTTREVDAQGSTSVSEVNGSNDGPPGTVDTKRDTDSLPTPAAASSDVLAKAPDLDASAAR